MSEARMGRLVTALAALATALAHPAAVWALCAPAASGIFPASGVVGTSVTATIVGESLDGATLTVLGESGLVATVQSANALAVNVHLDLDAAAVPGERLLLLETPAGSTAVSFTLNPAGGPVIAAVSPPLQAIRGIPLDVTVTGVNLAGVAPGSFAVSGAGVTLTSATPSPDGTSLALSFGVDSAADLGTHAVTLATPAGGAVLQLYVRRPPPTVATVSPAAGEPGASVPVTLTGTNLSGAALVVTGSGVVMSDLASPDDATLTATLAIDPGVSPSAEPRLLIVTTEGGQTTIEFFVVAPGVPTVTSIAPGAGEPGDTVALTLKGLHLTGATVSDATADLTLQNPMVVDDETLTLEALVAPGAAVNVDHTITVTVGLNSTPATFRVIPPGTPFVGAVRPPFGGRGATLTLFCDGVNLATVIPGTGVGMSGGGISTSNAAAVDDRTARAILDISPNANIGASRDVTVTTAGGSFTRDEAFRVFIPGQVPTITDVSPHVVQPGTTVPVTVTGSNFEGGTVLVTGPGATVANVVVDPGGTVITFDLTLAPDAPAENRAVIVITESGTARCGIASDPSPPPFLPARLVKTGATFLVPATGFRLFVFEFSLSELFAPGLRTLAIADPDGSLVLSRLDAVNVGRAFRESHRGFVRVRAVTPTNRLAVSAGAVVRR